MSRLWGDRHEAGRDLGGDDQPKTEGGSRIAMLYQGRVQQVGTVDEIRNSSDPIVRQFIEGRPSLDGEPLGVPAAITSAGSAQTRGGERR